MLAEFSDASIRDGECCLLSNRQVTKSNLEIMENKDTFQRCFVYIYAFSTGHKLYLRCRQLLECYGMLGSLYCNEVKIHRYA